MEHLAQSINALLANVGLVDFFLIGQVPADAMKGQFDLWMVALSYIVASVASYAAVNFSDMLVSRQKVNLNSQIIHLAGAFAMGAGIWSMHFIGMLAFHMDMKMSYDPTLTLASMAVAVVVAYGVLYLVKGGNLSVNKISLGAVLLGLGICGMHYTGMHAMQMNAHVSYIPWIFLLSVIIAMTASAAALLIIYFLTRYDFKQREVLKFSLKLCAALIMGAAICGMHYTGMFAAVFTHTGMEMEMHMHDAGNNAGSLGVLIAVVTLIILLLSTLVKEVSPALENSFSRLQEYAAVFVTACLGLAITALFTLYVHTVESERVLTDFQREAYETFRNFDIELDKHEVAQGPYTDTEIAEVIASTQAENAENGLQTKITSRPVGQQEQIENSSYNTTNSSVYEDHTMAAGHYWTVTISPLAGRYQPEIWLSLSGALMGLVVTSFISGYVLMLIRQRRKDYALQITLTRAKEEADRATAAANEATYAKSDFLATMSHEIRTPMNGVFGMLDLLLRTKLSHEQEDLARTAHKSAETLQSILNDILDFSKIEKGELTLEPIASNVHNLVDSIGDVFTAIAEQKGLSLLVRYAPGTPEDLTVDSTRLRQVLINLVGNAVKFTAQGYVMLTVEQLQAAEGKAFLQFSVKDTGIGIPKNQQNKIFDRFSQADASTTRRFGGTGLGLAISKSLVELMGGKINLESEEGKGSVFSFTLWFPLAQGVEPMPSQERRSGPADLKGSNVLVVEDHPINTQILREVIEHLQAKCVCTSSIKEAWEKMREETFDLVVIDHKLPDGTGVELAGRIKAEKEYVKSRLIAFTSLAAGIKGEDNTAFAKAGFDAYLTKPIRSSILENMLMAVRYRSSMPGMLVRQHLRQQDTAEQLLTVPTRKLHVLLAEDDVTNQKIASRFIQLFGSEVEVVGDGMLAAEAMEKGHFDLVFMDMRMPGMDGLEATRHIRNRERERGQPRTPIIAFTANATREDMDKCAASGMDDFISKPITLEKFRQCIMKWMDTLEVEEGEKSGETARKLATNDTDIDAEVFDPAHFEEATGGDHEFQEELIADFVEGAGIALGQLDTNIPGKEEWHKAAHKLKGSAINMGLKKLGTVCGKAEKATSGEDAAPYILIIREAFDEGLGTLKALKGTTPD